MTTWLLYQGGYDLGKFYALEEFYAEDLEDYYDALVTHPNHNYYFGSNEADKTPRLDYFLKDMSAVFDTDHLYKVGVTDIYFTILYISRVEKTTWHIEIGK